MASIGVIRNENLDTGNNLDRLVRFSVMVVKII
jgi:hypothetical protein